MSIWEDDHSGDVLTRTSHVAEQQKGKKPRGPKQPKLLMKDIGHDPTREWELVWIKCGIGGPVDILCNRATVFSFLGSWRRGVGSWIMPFSGHLGRTVGRQRAV